MAPREPSGRIEDRKARLFLWSKIENGLWMMRIYLLKGQMSKAPWIE